MPAIDINPGLKAAIRDLIDEFSFAEILTALASAAIVKGSDVAALGCKRETRRLSTLARDLQSTRDKAFPDS
jgi:hypothetical protein